MTEENTGEYRGKTVEAAISAGLTALRLSRDAVEVEIVRPGSRGVLGIGAEDAIVRLTPVRQAPRTEPRPAQRSEQQPRPAPVPRQEPRQEARQEPRQEPRQEARQEPRQEPRQEQRSEPRFEPKPAPASQPVRSEPRPAPVLGDDKGSAAADKGREILLGLLERMNLRADVEIGQQSDAEVEDGDRATVLNIVGEDLGVLIGRQNETLSAIEFLTRLMVNQQVRTRTSFIVDVNGYRAKRAEALRKLALRMAEQVVQTGRTMPMEPMPPAERRIIHLALRDHPGVSSQSVGEGDRRKVTIVPKKG